MKITIRYKHEVVSGVSTFCAEADTTWGKLTGASWIDFAGAKKQILEQIKTLKAPRTKESEEVEV